MILELTLTLTMTMAAPWWHPLWCVVGIDVGVGCCRGVSVGYVRGSSQRRTRRSSVRGVGIPCDRFAGLLHTEIPWLRRMHYFTWEGPRFPDIITAMPQNATPNKIHVQSNSKATYQPNAQTVERCAAQQHTCAGIISPLGPGHGHDRCRHDMHDALR